MQTVRDILRVLDTLAPPHLVMEGDPQPSRDPRALLIGDPDAPIKNGVFVALDVTQKVVDAAKVAGAGLIIAHHPLIYYPAKTVRADDFHPGAVVLSAIQAGIAVASAHTNWDVAPGGINDMLAGLLGLKNVHPLRITYREPLVSISVFVPANRRETVFDAMANAGAGAIGNYDRCGFWVEGTGTFRPLDGANPNVGAIGVREIVAEARLEMIAPVSKQTAIVAAMKAAHPYEEVAHYVHPLVNTHGAWGIGRVGTLAAPLSTWAFRQAVCDALGFPHVRLVGPNEKTIRTVAVCGGAGAFLMDDALAHGADAFVTSDVRHHEFVDADARGLALLDAGHAQTETPGTRELARLLSEKLDGVSVTFV